MSRLDEGRARLLAAARRAATETAASRVSLRDIAKAAGLSPAACYRYFPSRERLADALAVEVCAEIVAAALRAAFPKAVVEVEHDLLGAARAACGRSAGVACILGTGSNSCYFDGKKILDNVPSLGWLLGDEGSGTHLGKALLRAKFYRELPADLNTAFDEAYPEGMDAIKDRIYEKGANAYLATFTRFLGDHLQHPFVQDLVASCLGEFLDRQAGKYSGVQYVPLHFVGSIAYHFQSVLARCMEERKLKMGNIVRKPIYSLADYHKVTE